MDSLSENQKKVLSLFTTNGLSVGYARECIQALKINSPLSMLKGLKDKGLIELGKDSLGNDVIRRAS